LDPNEAVLKEDLFCCPNKELPCIEDPVPEPRVTVEPKLGSVFKPEKPDGCWPCPRDAKPD
jgi:hypothetical protein